ncbi:MAG TPA: glycosyltransferase [Solirubrobacterales bacterium]|nr:glycosyltransferase [Solirubrobacterales bacterium]
MPLKLLLVINLLSPDGGAEMQLQHLAKGLAANGHEVTLCCVDSCELPPQALAGTGVELVELGVSGRSGRPAAIPRLARLAREADVVHCTMWDASLWGRLGGVLARRPVVVADHATDRSVQVAADGSSRARWIALHNRLLDRFTFATVTCAGSQRRLLLSEGVSPARIVHIPNGVPVAALAAAATSGPSRADLDLPAAAPVAIQVGVFRTEKNQIGALEAFARVREDLPEVRLVFAGDGATRKQVERRAAELRGEEWVRFLGNRSDVPALLALSDLLLLPSTSDAMPMTVLEGMALGVPVLATDVGDVRPVVGDAGVCVPAGDPAAFGEAATEILRDAALRDRLGRAGLEQIPAYDAATMVRRYEALFAAARDGGDPIAAVDAV